MTREQSKEAGEAVWNLYLLERKKGIGAQLAPVEGASLICPALGSWLTFCNNEHHSFLTPAAANYWHIECVPFEAQLPRQLGNNLRDNITKSKSSCCHSCSPFMLSFLEAARVGLAIVCLSIHRETQVGTTSLSLDRPFGACIVPLVLQWARGDAGKLPRKNTPS